MLSAVSAIIAGSLGKLVLKANKALASDKGTGNVSRYVIEAFTTLYSRIAVW